MNNRPGYDLTLHGTRIIGAIRVEEVVRHVYVRVVLHKMRIEHVMISFSSGQIKFYLIEYVSRDINLGHCNISKAPMLAHMQYTSHYKVMMCGNQLLVVMLSSYRYYDIVIVTQSGSALGRSHQRPVQYQLSSFHHFLSCVFLIRSNTSRAVLSE